MTDSSPKDSSPKDSSPKGRPPDQGRDPSGSGATAASPETKPAGGGGSSGGPFWLIPALTFLVGVVLGGAVIAATTSGEEETPVAAPTTTSAPETAGESPRPDATVTVPGSCLELAEDAESVLTLLDQAMTAAQELDASDLGDIVRQLQEERAAVEQHASGCRGAATGQSSPTTT